MASGAVDFSTSYSGPSDGGVIKIPAGRSDYSWRTKSSVSCPSSVKPIVRKSHEVNVIQAVSKIELWWIRMRSRKIFRVLKDAICAAEHSLTHEVLRKLSPLEAELLKDPAIKARIKFRFGGDHFPPSILFKIFTSTHRTGRGDNISSGGVCYFSGKRMIKPASEAAEDARRQMGNRVFYDQMFQDACHHEQLKVTDEMDVTTMKEYMQVRFAIHVKAFDFKKYVANVDETPACLGGKDNTWRKINLDVLPRHSFLHHLVEFLEQSRNMHGQVGRGLSLERLQSLTRPQTQHEQIENIKTISSLSNHQTTPRPPSHTSGKEGSRRSRQAQQRVEKMRKVYGLDRSSEETGVRVHTEAIKKEKEEDWEQEADDLYQWTQELSFEDIT